jgi:hypothetical protein
VSTCVSTLLALGLACARPATGQWNAPGTIAYLHWGLVDPSVRDTLASHYRALFHDPAASEFGFCAVNVPDADGTPHIRAVLFPEQSGAPNYVTFRCPKGTLRGHAHPPGTCLTDPTKPNAVLLGTCRFGDAYGHQCMPSSNDERIAAREGLSLLMCDEHAVLFFSTVPPQVGLGPIRPPVVPPLPAGHPR